MKETLRLFPVIPALGRVLQPGYSHIVLGGHNIPAHIGVAVCLYSMHRRYFEHGKRGGMGGSEVGGEVLYCICWVQRVCLMQKKLLIDAQLDTQVFHITGDAFMPERWLGADNHTALLPTPPPAEQHPESQPTSHPLEEEPLMHATSNAVDGVKTPISTCCRMLVFTHMRWYASWYFNNWHAVKQQHGYGCIMLRTPTHLQQHNPHCYTQPPQVDPPATRAPSMTAPPSATCPLATVPAIALVNPWRA